MPFIADPIQSEINTRILRRQFREIETRRTKVDLSIKQRFG
jgi:hypothetical protein